MSVKSYEETLDYLYSQLPMFSRIGAAAYKKDITNTIALCDFIGNPQNEFRSIHVAGTNGKGSSSHFLASIFQEAGYKTGLYTSPHIHDFRERIRINGKMAEKEFVVDFVERIKSFSEKIQPSFFELTVAMAFEYFAVNKVDIAIIETGLGGRLDSTNVIHPELSVITNIGFDHVNLLGDTLEKIAVEKAGIIKKDTPVVIGQHQIETDPVFIHTAKDKNAELIFAEDRWKFIKQEWDKFYFLNQEKEIEIRSGLPGSYQRFNIPAVLTAIDQMNKAGWKISDTATINGIANVYANTGIEGRWQKIHSEPDIILDVAHNEDGIKQVLEQLTLQYPKRELHFIMGFVNDKPLNKVLKLFPSAANYYFTQAHIPRALSGKALASQADDFNLKGKIFPDVNQALSVAKANATPDDVILVCGSFFVIAEVDSNLL